MEHSASAPYLSLLVTPAKVRVGVGRTDGQIRTQTEIVMTVSTLEGEKEREDRLRLSHRLLTFLLSLSQRRRGNEFFISSFFQT